MLSNFDIKRLANKLRLPIVGVYSKDELPNIERKIGSYYINMQDSDKGGGTHWVYARIYSDDDKVEESESEDDVSIASSVSDYDKVKALYFDSFGVGMPKEVFNFLKPYKPIASNDIQIQSVNSSQCGWYCLACDYYLTYKAKEDELIDDYENFLSLWSDNPRQNLTLLKKFFKPL
jgi:hypothetical protein